MTTTAHLVFDLDGTISDPVVGIGRSLNYALTHFGYPTVADDQIARYIGPPLDETFVAITATSDPEDIAGLVGKYRERYVDIGYSENVIYPGIREALAALAGRRTLMGVCTSKRADYAGKILKLFDIHHHFRFVDGGDIGIQKQQQLAALLSNGIISPESSLIGDRAVDVHAANANGLRSVAVLWGHGSLSELEAAQPDLILQSPHQLIELAI
ncbi:MAG TPA: HAD hydrolase-like protein [Pyrinomonadaceae bacterium]